MGRRVAFKDSAETLMEAVIQLDPELSEMQQVFELGEATQSEVLLMSSDDNF